MRTDPTDSHDPHRAPNGAAIQVLVVSHEAARRRSVEAALLGLVAAVSGVADLPGPDACGHFDVVLIDAAALGEHLGSTLLVPAGTALVVVGGERDAADLRAAMRLGAHDVADHGLAGSVLLERVLGACAVARSRAARADAERRRTADLRRGALELDRARTELDRQMDRICADLSGAAGSLSRQVRDVAMASELNTLLRQELELEGLLRTTLEFAARRIGSANVAIFLTEHAGDFGLGAYVNYDCPRDTVEDLLEEVAGSLAPRLAQRDGVVLLARTEDVREVVGGRCAWLDDSAVCACACRPDGECLGVVVFFRDSRHGFSEIDQATVRVISTLFGRQLSRVVKTSTRHKPAGAWDSRDTDIAA